MIKIKSINKKGGGGAGGVSNFWEKKFYNLQQKRPGNSIISGAWPNQTYYPGLTYWLSFRIHKLSANRRVGLVWHCTRNYTIARPLYSFDRKYLLWQEMTYFDMNIILKALLLKDMRTNCWKYGKVHDYWSIFPVTFQSFVGRIFQPSR